MQVEKIDLLEVANPPSVRSPSSKGRSRREAVLLVVLQHDPAHVDMPHEVTVIKGRRFPTCRHCKGFSFELVHAAKRVSEVPHFGQEASPQDALTGTA